jgi:hypothetical protein
MITKIIKKIKKLLDILDEWLQADQPQPTENTRKSIYEIL